MSSGRASRPWWALRLVSRQDPIWPPRQLPGGRCPLRGSDRRRGHGFTQILGPLGRDDPQQGVGRRSDPSAIRLVAILDRPLVQKGYGRALLAVFRPPADTLARRAGDLLRGIAESRS